MTAEAVDTAVTLGWALLAWIVAGAVVATAGLYAVLAAVWLAWHGVRRACRGAWRGRGAPERGSCDSSAAGTPERAADARTANLTHREAA